MSVIVTDTGFGPDNWPQAETVDLQPDADPQAMVRKMHTLRGIRINFPSFADGRGFTIARQLRLLGFTGRLRARGHVLADQYAMARRAGFDEVEIDADLAARQPESQWLARADWQRHDYQSRLRG